MEVNTLNAPPGPASVAGTNSLAENFDNFLRLLTTQLKYQDPLSPMDTAEFTNQLTQFSQVEQAIKTNAKLEDLLALNQRSQALSATNFIGKTVEAKSKSVSLQNGEAEIVYALPGGVSRAVLLISDSGGRIVRAVEGDTGEGRHHYTWDGNDGNGVQMPANEVYSLSINATGENGDPLDGTAVGIVGVVDEVVTEGGLITLMIGETPVDLDRVVAIRNAQNG